MEANLFSLVDVTDRNLIFAWGMEIVEEETTNAIVYRRDPDTGRTLIGRHGSAESALERYGRRIPLALVWEYDEILEAFGIGEDLGGDDGRQPHAEGARGISEVSPRGGSSAGPAVGRP